MLKSKYFLKYILVIILISISSYLFINSDFYNLKCVISDVDGNRYCVRERKRIKEAANILATVVNKCEKLIIYLVKKYPDNDAVKRLEKKFDKNRCARF